MSLNLEKKYQLFIDGEWVEPSGKDYLETTNPATGEVITEIANASDADVDLAVKAAREALEDFGQSTTGERSKLLFKIADIIEENADRLARIESTENGKPIRETSAIDLPLAVDHFRYFGSVIRSEEGTVKLLDGRHLSLIIKEPIGVVAQIIPWNFPFLMAAWKLAPALAAGDTIVLKPSSKTSLSVLELVKLIADELPKGVLNVITGKGSESGDYLQHHEGIDKVAFTGSTEVGREIGIAAAKNLIPSTLELGGKSANIIFEDADMDKALDGAMLGITFNQGQVCSAGSRLFLQESIYDEFLERLIKIFENLKIGDPLDESTEMGTQIDEAQIETIMKYVQSAKDEGLTIVTGGERVEKLKGAFMQPTIIEAEDNKATVCREEIFGPVLVVQKFKDVDEVIKLANDTNFGLTGGVFTKDINRALKVARSVRTGRMWVNTYNQLPAGAPFGGFKDSGIGRENHKMMLDAYTKTKNIFIDLDDELSGFYNIK